MLLTALVTNTLCAPASRNQHFTKDICSMLAKSALVTTPMIGRFIDEIKPGEKGDHGASALSTSAIMSASQALTNNAL
ncbi:hypothetical protein EC2021H102_43890 [Escherichia coli]